jgi:isoquinoline 1-oxidoreductase alpha subunit
MVRLSINGKNYDVDADPNTPLLWAIREQVGLTGTKYGCGIAQCGACTVHIDGAAVRSCTMPAAAASGKKITTIEGLASGDTLHKVQKAWLEHDVPQCGFCQSGMIMAAAALLREKPRPTDADIDARSPTSAVAARSRKRAPRSTRPRKPKGGAMITMPKVSRRSFIVGSAAAGGGLALGLRLPPFGPAVVRAADGSPEITVWVAIRPDNTTIVRVVRAEMGQGTITGLVQLIAEELECDWNKIVIEYPTPARASRASARGASSPPAAAAASGSRTSTSARAAQRHA